MAPLSADIVTKRIDLEELPNIASRIIDLAPDPRGGYFALCDVEQAGHEATSGHILAFDDAHNLRQSWAFSVASPDDAGYSLVRTAAMSVSAANIFVVGTIAPFRPGLPEYVFVIKFSLDGDRQGVRIYPPQLLDGCQVPYRFHCTGRGIARLAAPDDDRLMVLFETTVLSDGFGAPPLNDSVGAAIFTIDDNLDVKSDVTRLFCRGQFAPTRLRVLPRFGPTITGKTRWPLAGPAPWDPVWVRVDATGNPVQQHAYGLGRDAVLNDVAASGNDILLVGSFQPVQAIRTALAIHSDDLGNTLWIAEYTPPIGAEFFGCGLNAIATLDDEFIAGGWHDSSASTERPWLLRLNPYGPVPVWSKRYPVHPVGSVLNQAFHALLFNKPNRVIGGGDILRRITVGTTTITDRLPFLAVSESEPGIDAPQCSVPADVQPVRPNFDELPGTPWLDRMRILAPEWIPTSETRRPPYETLCPGQTPPVR